MQNANQILQALHKLGTKRLPLTRVYRNLYSEELFLAAYDKIARNQGALTPGPDLNTVDGMTLDRIRRIIDALRNEHYRFRPARRSYTTKKDGGSRALGLPNFDDKLVQEALRLLLEAYYEPRFRDSSHGFRPERGCHTALTSITQQFQGSVWFIEGDIRGCFDKIDWDILLAILARDIHDGRFLNLIQQSLQAGVLEGRRYTRTYSGTAQGSILSPILANIYLNELDTFIEETLLPQYNRGTRRQVNLAYKRYEYPIKQAWERGDSETAHRLRHERRALPSQDTHDPTYRRLHYVRYADDWILGFIGPKSEAEAIKTSVATYLREQLYLELSLEKTLITHARTKHATFLGYAISIYQADEAISLTTGDSRKDIRSINGGIRLGIPQGLVTQLTQRYQQNNRVISDIALLDFSDAHIIDVYQRRFRGIADYYKYATDRCYLNKLKYVMEVSLLKTLARKYRISVKAVYRRYRGSQQVDGRRYKTLQVEVPTAKGPRLLCWGAISLKTTKPGSEPLDDQRYEGLQPRARSDLIQRLQADTCELCGSPGNCEVHHIRKLADLKKPGRKEKPAWQARMIALQRKTLIVCVPCHKAIHAGRKPVSQK